MSNFIAENQITYPGIGILGGTFDPIHNGHLQIAQNILHDFKLEHILFIPCYQPVHRDTPQATAEQRLAMVEIAVAEENKFIVDNREIIRQGPSYMIDTLISLRNDYPECALCLIIGFDALRLLPGWKRWQELLNYAHLIVVNRQEEHSLKLESELQDFINKRQILRKEDLFLEKNGKIFFYNMPFINISATEIRQQLERKREVIHDLPNNVLKYIKENKIYKK